MSIVAWPVHLPNSQLASESLRFCFDHQAKRPADGGCEIAPGKWFCASCWVKRKFRPAASRAQNQNGSVVFGLLLGVLIGLGLGVATAVAVTKVSRPFVGRAVSRDAIEDREESIRNRGWDPNAPLRARSAATPLPATVLPPEIQVLGANPGDLPAIEDEIDPYLYFVQAKAFDVRERAEDFRTEVLARGQDALVVKRGGKFFVRLGPYPSRGAAERLKDLLDAAGCQCALVRVAQ